MTLGVRGGTVLLQMDLVLTIFRNMTSDCLVATREARGDTTDTAGGGWQHLEQYAACVVVC